MLNHEYNTRVDEFYDSGMSLISSYLSATVNKITYVQNKDHFNLWQHVINIAKKNSVYKFINVSIYLLF